jgi:hypothetical protein
MTTAAVTDTRRRLRLRAAVVVTFRTEELFELAPPPDDVEVLDFLEEDCQQVPVPGGPAVWTLGDPVRAAVFAADGDRLLLARSEVDAVPDTPVQRALDRSLQTGWGRSDIVDLDDEETAALAVVARWWAGSRPGVPPPAVLAAHLHRRMLFADARAMATDHFIGREDVLADLRARYLAPAGRAVSIWGIGGVGKSALLARLVMDVVDDPSPYDRGLVVMLDFDDPAVNPDFPVEFVSAIAEQVQAQIGAESSELSDVRSRIISESEYGSYRSDTLTRTASVNDVPWVRLLDEVLDRVGGRLLLVLDTVEQAQRRGPSAMYVLALILRRVVSRPEVLVVLSGRARMPELRDLVDEVELVGLAGADAIYLMVDMAEGAVDHPRAAALVDRFGTSPLTVRLVAALLAKTQGGDDPLFGLRAANEQLDAELYLRILGHIKDPTVRALAHPGLVLRRVTPEIIRRVLAEACEIPMDGLDEQVLFTRLAAEPMLVDRPERDVLVHRQDVRAVMLPQILRDPKVDATAVQLAAIAYYSGRRDPAARTEELYHRLLLGQTREEIEPRWDPRAAEQLAAAVGELPQRSRVFLLSRLRTAFLDEDDRRLLDEAVWIEKVEPTATQLLARGGAAAALALLRERRRPDGGPILPLAEIEALEALGQLDEAIALAGREAEAAAAGLNATGLVDLTLQQCRLAELAGRPADSLTFLDRAIEVTPDQSVDRLRLQVAWLGVVRRNRLDRGEERERRAEEAARLGRAATTRRLGEYPGLLRDLAAEVGDEAGDVLDTALRSVGFDAHKSGTVPDALADLADSPERTGQVVDLLRLDQDPQGPVEWRQVVNQNRSESGLGVAEVLSAFPKDTGNLRDAVLNDYRSEADAAYRGVDQSDELRWDGPA